MFQFNILFDHRLRLKEISKRIGELVTSSGTEHKRRTSVSLAPPGAESGNEERRRRAGRHSVIKKLKYSVMDC